LVDLIAIEPVSMMKRQSDVVPSAHSSVPMYQPNSIKFPEIIDLLYFPTLKTPD
jgi:hypothetical protein